MPEYDNTNRGALFRPKERRSENSPHWRGTVNVGGVDWELSIWEKTSRSGLPFLSCSFKPPFVKQDGAFATGVDPARAALGPQKPGDYKADLDDEIPF